MIIPDYIIQETAIKLDVNRLDIEIERSLNDGQQYQFKLSCGNDVNIYKKKDGKIIFVITGNNNSKIKKLFS